MIPNIMKNLRQIFFEIDILYIYIYYGNWRNVAKNRIFYEDASG